MDITGYLMQSIPASHRDLFERPIVVSLATIAADGSPQVMPMWADLDGDAVRVNTALGRQKCTNMLNRPAVSILAVDPDNGHRFLEIRGTAERSGEDANAHADKLITEYQGAAFVPTVARQETRIVFRILPRSVHISE